MLESNNRFIEILRESRAQKRACASINILNYATARAIIRAAQRAGRPVILQPSSGTVRHYGVSEMFRMLDGLRRESESAVAIHLDHCTDEALAFACIDAGWDAVMVDYSIRPLEENIAMTRRVVEYAHSRGVAVEGEVGVIAGVEDEIRHETAVPASLEDTTAFISRSGIDAVAPAIGTAHGAYSERPVLNFDLVDQLGTADAFVVVHGGTGLPEADFQRLIRLGAAKINISTALKQAYLRASRQALQKDGIDPLEFDSRVEESVGAEMERFIRLFAGEDIRL